MEAAGGKHGQRSGSHPHESARPSLWSRHGAAESPRQATLIRALGQSRSSRQKSTQRSLLEGTRSLDDGRFASPRALGADVRQDGSHLLPIELLVLFEILRDEGAFLPTEMAGKLWRIGLTAAIQRTAADGRTIRSADGVRFLDAELDWQSGLLFAPVAGAECVATCGRDALTGVLMQSTDAAGVPSAEIVGELRNWLTTPFALVNGGIAFGRRCLMRPKKNDSGHSSVRWRDCAAATGDLRFPTAKRTELPVSGPWRLNRSPPIDSPHRRRFSI